MILEEPGHRRAIHVCGQVDSHQFEIKRIFEKAQDYPSDLLNRFFSRIHNLDFVVRVCRIGMIDGLIRINSEVVTKIT